MYILYAISFDLRIFIIDQFPQIFLQELLKFFSISCTKKIEFK